MATPWQTRRTHPAPDTIDSRPDRASHQWPAPPEESLGTRLWEDFKGGNLGSAPVIVGLTTIVIVFAFTAQNFFTAVNLNNIIVQMAGTTMLAYGVVFVLLLGEIDLSIAYLSGTPTHDHDFLEAADGLLGALDSFPEAHFLVVGYLSLDERFERFGSRVTKMAAVPWRRLPRAASRDARPPARPHCARGPPSRKRRRC